jgi:hypothetical protein
MPRDRLATEGKAESVTYVILAIIAVIIVFLLIRMRGRRAR